MFVVERITRRTKCVCEVVVKAISAKKNFLNDDKTNIEQMMRGK